LSFKATQKTAMPYKKHIKPKLSFIKHSLICVREVLLDIRAYFASAFIYRFIEKHHGPQLESQVVRLSHVIEKGLAMPDFKPRSGKQSVAELARLLRDPATRGRVAAEQITVGEDVLDAYIQKHEALGISVSDLFEWPRLEAKQTANAGVKPWQPISKEDSEAFFRVSASRMSVRAFQADRVPEKAVIDTCIQNAMQSPSVCNRQTWRVHIFTGDKVPALLTLQNGNRGFGHTLPMLMLVTVDMRHFCGAEERFQPWIEGGIFSMALMLAMHASSLASVPLNWSVLNSRDHKMRAIAGIPDHERSIMFIGCGYPQEDATAAMSFRRKATEVTRWHS
jgi:nitroreductase